MNSAGPPAQTCPAQAGGDRSATARLRTGSFLSWVGADMPGQRVDRIEAVIFDLDGVIIDSEPLWREAEIAAYAGIGVTMTDAMCRQTAGMRIGEVVALWFRRFGLDPDGARDTEAAVMRNVTALVQERGEPMDGLMESLAFWQAKGIPLAVASSSGMGLILGVLDKLGIADRFQAVHSAEFEPFGKPHPCVYLSAARMLGVLPEACLAIEDSINGVIAAKAAGMRCIAVPDAVLTGDRRLGIADAVLPSLAHIDETLWDALTMVARGHA